MSERRRADRLEQIVERLLAGRRPRVRPNDVEDKEAILAAARLAAARESYPRMSSRFRRRLAAQLLDRPRTGLTRRSALVAGVAFRGCSREAGPRRARAPPPSTRDQDAGTTLARSPISPKARPSEPKPVPSRLTSSAAGIR
jgi:hypothetical protein